jgi:hypothetical protein
MFAQGGPQSALKMYPGLLHNDIFKGGSVKLLARAASTLSRIVGF